VLDVGEERFTKELEPSLRELCDFLYAWFKTRATSKTARGSCSSAPCKSRYDTERDAGSLVAVRAGIKGFDNLKTFERLTPTGTASRHPRA
jgi:hypothetical protein